METVFRLDIQYDVARLLEDLKNAERVGQYQKHWAEDYYEGVWVGMPLVSRHGDLDSASIKRPRGNFEKTKILAECPYFEEVIDSFHCPHRRVRLLRLDPGAKINKHCDPTDTWAMGVVRLHIPIVTHDEIYFFVDGQRVMMKPGEAWYCDFSRPHWVENLSDIIRVHLVIDLVVNDWLCHLFPTETTTERAANWIYWYRIKQGNGVRMIRRKLGRLRFQQ